MRLRPLSLALAVLCMVALQRGVVRAGDKAIDDVDASVFSFGSMSIGQAKDVDYARAEGLGLVPTMPFDAYLNGVLTKLLAQSPMKNVPARVYVRASGDWGATTTADANIYVSLGTLLRLDNEDELAALLGHEASHVILGHANADVVQDVQQRAIQVSSLALGAMKGAGKEGGADKTRVEEQSNVLLLNSMLISPAWNRSQERSADLLGIDLMVRAGYSPQAALSLLRKQAQFENERARDPDVQAMDKKLSLFGIDVHQPAQQQGEKVAKGTGTEDLVGGLVNAGIGKALEWGSKKVADVQRSHPKAEDRLTDALQYITREYPDAASKAVQTAPWEAAKDQDTTADVLENYIAAIDAKGKLADGDVAAATKLAKQSLAEPTRAHAYPNYVDAAVQIAQGKSPSALADYQAALGGPEPAGAIYAEASTVYISLGKNTEAQRIMETGYARLQEPPALTVPLIRTYRALGQQSEADRIAAECAARWPKMQALCHNEANGIQSK